MNEQPPADNTPPLFEIPPELAEKWLKLDPSAPAQITLTRGDLDNLMLGIRQTIVAQSDLGLSLRHVGQGEFDKASEAYDKFFLSIQNAYDRTNRFITAVMSQSVERAEAEHE